ncbi:MAG: hypothetical protein ACTS6G_03835 [Candidatus Hodgkinia cicadicola]
MLFQRSAIQCKQSITSKEAVRRYNGAFAIHNAQTRHESSLKL